MCDAMQINWKLADAKASMFHGHDDDDDEDEDEEDEDNEDEEMDDSSDFGKSYTLRACSIQKRIETEHRKSLPRKRGPKPRPKSAPMSKYRRKTANLRERVRMGEINTAFEKLRDKIPNPVMSGRGKCEKLTKINILHVAINYIRAMENILETGESRLTSYSEMVRNPIRPDERPPKFVDADVSDGGEDENENDGDRADDEHHCCHLNLQNGKPKQAARKSVVRRQLSKKAAPVGKLRSLQNAMPVGMVMMHTLLKQQPPQASRPAPNGLQPQHLHHLQQQQQQPFQPLQPLSVTPQPLRPLNHNHSPQQQHNSVPHHHNNNHLHQQQLLLHQHQSRIQCNDSKVLSSPSVCSSGQSSGQSSPVKSCSSMESLLSGSSGSALGSSRDSGLGDPFLLQRQTSAESTSLDLSMTDEMLSEVVGLVDAIHDGLEDIAFDDPFELFANSRPLL